jgi:hypothetical protein
MQLFAYAMQSFAQIVLIAHIIFKYLYILAREEFRIFCFFSAVYDKM